MADALIETVRVLRGHAPLWPLHEARLRASAAALGLTVPADLMPPLGGADRAVRLELGAAGLARTAREVGDTAPVHLATVGVPHPGYPHKTTARGAFVAAREDAESVGADDGLLCVADGSVGETSIWALGWWTRAGLVFPPLALGVLPSVGRARIGELGPVGEGRIHPEALAEHACLVVNAVRGVVAVASLDGRPLPSDARTTALQAEFWQV